MVVGAPWLSGSLSHSLCLSLTLSLFLSHSPHTLLLFLHCSEKHSSLAGLLKEQTTAACHSEARALSTQKDGLVRLLLSDAPKSTVRAGLSGWGACCFRVTRPKAL